MMRAEAEERGQSFGYKAGTIAGTARILESPPKLKLGRA